MMSPPDLPLDSSVDKDFFEADSVSEYSVQRDTGRQPVLDVSGVTKAFPGVVALEAVNFDVRANEVHAIVGENGAGKSTLIKILSGVYQPDAGNIAVDGEKVTIANPLAAAQLGIATVHQESHLVPNLSVAENIFLGHQPETRTHRLDVRKRNARAAEILNSLQCHLDVHAVVDGLPVAQAQMVAIARAMTGQPKVLILDEPTASLSPSEASSLFDVLRSLQQNGVSIVYISHRLDEVFELATRITVLRDGRVITTTSPAESDMDRVVTMMVGRPPKDLFVRLQRPEPGPEVLRVTGLSIGTVVRNASLTVRRGELVALFGLVGSGRTELVRAIMGADSSTHGQVLLDGQRIRSGTIRRSIKAGIGIAPEDRKRDGLIQELSVSDNILLSANALQRSPFYWPKRIRSAARRYVEQLGIKVARIGAPVRLLSGGNQQRVVIAKLLAAKPRLLILDEPTQGVDIGAKAEMYRLISGLLEDGLGVLMVSSDLPEVLGISDRVLVMRDGEIVSQFERAEATAEAVGRAAIGFGADARTLLETK